MVRNTFKAGLFRASADSVAFFYQSLDERPSEKSYLGMGAAELVGPSYHTVCVDSLSGAGENAGYVLSLWVYVRQVGQATSTIFLKQYNEEGQQLQQRTYGIGFQATAFDPHGWVLLECPFNTVGSTSTIEVGIHWPKADDKQKIWVDEVLVKPAGVNLSRQTPATFWWNNRHWALENGKLKLTE